MASPASPSIKSKIVPLLLLAKAHGRTCEELENLLRAPHQTVSARLAELHKADLIKNSGRSRQTQWGDSAAVWIAPEFIGIDPRFQEMVELLTPVIRIVEDIQKSNAGSDISATIQITQGIESRSYALSHRDLEAIVTLTRTEH